MIDEENINEEISNFNQFLVENDGNKKEFLENENKEQLRRNKKKIIHNIYLDEKHGLVMIQRFKRKNF